MTPNERKTMEAVIALLDAVTYIRGSGSAAEPLRTHRGILQAALDADRAPRECDPYATLPWAVVRDLTATQQYDADPPREPGRETPEAPK